MTTITADQLRDLANIQHARSLGETPLHQTPAWLAAERIATLEEQLAELEIQTAQLSARLVESDVERDKLAAHMERLDSAGHALYYELEQWSLTEGDPETKAAMKLWRLARGEEPVTSLAQHDAAVRREFAEAIWDEMLKRQKVIKVLPLTMAKEWDERCQGGAA